MSDKDNFLEVKQRTICTIRDALPLTCTGEAMVQEWTID